jgi:hypothetical protein
MITSYIILMCLSKYIYVLVVKYWQKSTTSEEVEQHKYGTGCK